MHHHTGHTMKTLVIAKRDGLWCLRLDGKLPGLLCDEQRELLISLAESVARQRGYDLVVQDSRGRVETMLSFREGGVVER